MSEKIIMFDELVAENFEKLDLFTTAITRVHGENHPEAFEVRKLFESIQSKVKADGINKADLVNEFKQLRKVTDNYKVPSDVCETYDSVYHMLSELDQSYQAK